jgi:F0F1-type ATP synthase assembly protein I
MSEIRSEGAPNDKARDGKETESTVEAKDDTDDLASRFPDMEKDARLHIPIDLPEPPKLNIERPNTRAARGELSDTDDSLRLGAYGTVQGRDLRGMGAASTIGLTLVLSIAVGAGLGFLVDKYLLGSPTTPYGLIVGFLLGVASGFVSLVRIANQLNRDDEKR